jgi:hypothetical protein
MTPERLEGTSGFSVVDGRGEGIVFILDIYL